MENRSTKLDKAVKIGIYIPAVFLAVFVLSGCSKKTTTQTGITNSEQNQDSQTMEDLKKQNEEQQKQLDILQKNQEKEACQKKKEDCATKLNAIGNSPINLATSIGEIGTGDRLALIKKKEDLIENRENSLEEDKKRSSMSKELKEQYLKDISNAKKDITKIKGIMESEATEKSNLLAGECKDYQNPCE